MAIKVYLDEVLKERNMTSKELSTLVGITEANQNILRKVYDKHDETIQFFVDEEQPALSGKLLNLDWN